MSKSVSCLVISTGVLFAASLGPALAEAPSFDCSRARYDDEFKICSTPELAKLDKLTTSGYLYIKTSEGVSSADAVRVPFWKARHACGSDPDCIRKRQLQAIAAYRAEGAPISIPEVPSGQEYITHPLINGELPALPLNSFTPPSPADKKGQGHPLAQDNQQSVPQNAVSGTSPSNPTIKTVVAEGVGKDVESAAKNAAENALTQVVGSFIQTDTLMKKRVELNDEIKQQSLSIEATTREYSQGSIKAFTVLDTSQRDGLVRVTAQIDVRVEDFKALRYFKWVNWPERHRR